ncbi:xylulokinase [bacterium]|nr:MAG: xylulokinase [bacterium]
MSLLGLDVGTSGVKALLIDESGKTLASATSEYPLSTPHPNWAEQDPADWWKGTIEVIRSILAAPGVRAGDIKGIGLSGQMHSLVLLDKQQRVLRPSILWCDTRTDKECREITEQVGRERLRSLVSNPALEGFTLPKIIWVRNHEPEVYAKIRTILLPKDYIRYLLTGEFAMEVSDAAGTLMFDVARRAWSKDLLGILNVPPEWLPPVFESVDVCGHVTRAIAELTGLREGTPVVGGGADNPCGAVGTGVVKQGRVLASIGTSGVVFAFSDQVRVEPGMRVHTFCHSVPGAWYLMGVVLMAGGALRWYRDTFAQDEMTLARTSGRDVYDILTEGASAVAPGSEGLFFLPYLVGERTPHQSASARGAFIGATIRHTKRHFTRAVLEGITFGMKDSLSIMEGLGVEIQQIRLTGGGAKSAFWRRLQANVYGREVALVNASEGPAFGAALLAGAGTKVYSSLVDAVENAVKVTETIAPDREEAKRYAELFGIYQELYPALSSSFTRIHTLKQ